MADVAPPPTAATIDALAAELDGLLVERDLARRGQRSRDCSWFSPVLAERLEGALADLVVAPLTLDELKRTVAACARHRVPLTVRGGGSGTRGQAVPLAGGVVVDTGYLNRVLAVGPGFGRAQAGCALGVFDAVLHERGQALRLHASNRTAATIGGFVAAGGAGVGSVTWGTMRDFGAVRALRVMTVESAPRLLELRGGHVGLAMQSFGTTGLVTEVEVPTAPATRWFERVLGFASLDEALGFADRLARTDAIVKRLVSVVAAPVASRYLFAHAGLDEATHVVLVMAADSSLETFDALVAEHSGEPLAVASSPLFELSWHHVTSRALGHDRGLTLLEALLPAPDPTAIARTLAATLPAEEVMWHLEFIRQEGRVCCAALPLVRYTTAERLDALAAAIAAAGGRPAETHEVRLGAAPEQRARLAFKQEIDPHGLLNPGKLGSAASG